MPDQNKKRVIGLCVLIILVLLGGVFLYDLSPVDANAKSTVFEIKQGDGFRSIVSNLKDADLIRSTSAFEAYSLFGGEALKLKPGLYRLSGAMSTPDILKTIAGGNAGEITVTIPEGSNIFEIDKILSNALVIRPGELINASSSASLEGKLFPDTYNFFTAANVNDVIKELNDNWDVKAAPLFAGDKTAAQDLIVASILEKEVPDLNDQKIVAGILWKRIREGIPLDVDATICYAKLLKRVSGSNACYPLTALDFKIDSPYNTYLYKGLPPTPIGNPGISAIMAAEHPESSPYLYYLSDPKTGKTVFATTLDEQTQNKVKYLEQ